MKSQENSTPPPLMISSRLYKIDCPLGLGAKAHKLDRVGDTLGYKKKGRFREFAFFIYLFLKRVNCPQRCPPPGLDETWSFFL